MLTLGKLSELIKELAPTQYNSIIIDNAVAIKEYRYCYIRALTQKVEFRSDSATVAVDEELEKLLNAEIFSVGNGDGQEGDAAYIPVDKMLVSQVKEAHKVSGGGFFSNAKKKLSELMNGGRDIDLSSIRLLMDGDRLAKNQPVFVVRAECSLSDCPNCKGTKTVSSLNKDGQPVDVECPECEGTGRVASVSWFTPVVSEKTVSIMRCLEGDIENIKASTLEAHKGDDSTLTRMLTRVNGEDSRQYPSEFEPYIDVLHDKTGEGNAIEDVYYRIIPCYTFVYRNVLTGKINTGAVIDPDTDAEIVLDFESSGSKVVNGVKDRIKGISRFFGNIGKTDSFKDNEDLRRTIRLLIAIAVADGDVSEEEKQTLTLSIRDIHQLTTAEQEQLLSLLGSADSSFLTDDDFKFHSRENAEMTINRMQEIASSDGLVDVRERDIIERLRFTY